MKHFARHPLHLQHLPVVGVELGPEVQERQNPGGADVGHRQARLGKGRQWGTLLRCILATVRILRLELQKSA